MAMIQGIDAGALIRAFRAGKEDRAGDDQARAKAQAAERESTLMGNMFIKPKGVAAQMGVPSFDQAFGADTQAAIANGSELPALPKPAAPAMAAQQPQRMELNPEAFTEMTGVNPERAKQIVDAIKTADEVGLKRMQAKNDALAQGAAWLAKVPLAERPAAVREVLMPHLTAAGWTPEEIASRPMTDQALGLYQNQALTMDQIIDNELAQRKYNDGDVVTTQAGGAAFRVRPNGETQPIVLPNDGSKPAGAPAGGVELPRPSSPAERDALPDGAQYIAPDGSIRTKSGGPQVAPAGSFPGQ